MAKSSLKIDSDIIEAGKRASDIVNEYRTHRTWDELSRKWIAFRLADGSYDGTLYDSKRDAVRHQHDEFHCAYVSFANLVNGSTPREMAVFLQFNRDAYKAGMRLPDPDHQRGGAQPLITTAQGDYYRNQFNAIMARNAIQQYLADNPLLRRMISKGTR